MSYFQHFGINSCLTPLVKNISRERKEEGVEGESKARLDRFWNWMLIKLLFKLLFNNATANILLALHKASYVCVCVCVCVCVRMGDGVGGG